MAGFSFKGYVLMLLLILLLLCYNFEVCEARRGKHWKQRRIPDSSLTKKKGKGKAGGGSHNNHHGGGGGGGKNPAPMPSPSPSSSHNSMFNVLDFGAKGDGVTDDTKAFEDAWMSACQVEASTVQIPSDYTFLIGPISFSGPYCQPNIIFQLDGTIVAPTNSKIWSSGLLWWIEFTKLKGITIQGNGTIEGRGSVWWSQPEPNDEPISEELGKKMPSIKPTALRFYGSYNVTVTGITKACVSNITVQDVNMYGTMTGVRIKTWQGGSGSVQSIRFSNIRVSEVQTPIVIDQFYCDRSSCKNQTAAVALSSIAYESIKGTYTVKPVHLACSDGTPCSDISLTEIELQPMQEHYHMYDPFCWQTFGELYTPTVPPILCMQNGKPTSNRILSDHDIC
uniref:Polygalacturonase 7 n=1 Tax=Oncidium hybrid cultivar TaxID=141207 RepID=A8D0V5_ONCHC|nr:polygalacturonase 7 [Oncidium hybrid cultivar]